MRLLCAPRVAVLIKIKGRREKGGAPQAGLASSQMRQMRLRITPSFDEFAKILFAELKLDRRQPAPKQLMPQPNAIGVDNIALTVVGRHNSCSADFAGDVNEDRTSHRSIASSVYRLK